MAALNIFGPPAFDEGQHGYYFLVGQDVFVGRHVRFVVIISNDMSEAVLGTLEQHLIRVVPGVPGRVMRWRGHFHVRSRRSPVRLAFQIRPMAGGAIGFVNLCTGFDELDIFVIQHHRKGRRARPHDCQQKCQCNRQTRAAKGVFSSHSRPLHRLYASRIFTSQDDDTRTQGHPSVQVDHMVVDHADASV